MNKEEKIKEVELLNDMFKDSENAILVGFRGMNVEQVSELRGKIREKDSGYRVVKNRLARIAVKGTPLESLTDDFVGPTAVAFNNNDPVALAKVIADFAKINKNLEVKTGVVCGKVIEKDGLKELASLPSADQLKAMLISTLMAPANKLARLLAMPSTNLVSILEQKKKTME